MKKKTEPMIPGKRYRGWGFINEFNEFQFDPEQTGSREGTIKQVCQREGISVSHSKDNILVHLKIKKSKSKVELLQRITNTFNKLFSIIKEYEF